MFRGTGRAGGPKKRGGGKKKGGRMPPGMEGLVSLWWCYSFVDLHSSHLVEVDAHSLVLHLCV
jgi:hypothetical protein